MQTAANTIESRHGRKAVIIINAHEEFSVSPRPGLVTQAKRAKSSNLAENKHGSAVIIINDIKLS